MPQKRKNWISVIRRRGEPVLMNSHLLTAYQDQYHQEILLLPRGVHDAKYIDGLVIFETNDIGELQKCFAERITPEYFSYFISKCRDETSRLLRTAREIWDEAPYGQMINNELLVRFMRYSSDVISVMPYLAGIVILEGVLQKHIEDKLRDHCQKNNIEVNTKVYLNSLIFPQEKSIPSQALIELYELGAEVELNSSLRKIFNLEVSKALSNLSEKFPNFMEALDTYLDKYDFMDMEYFAGRPITPENLFGRIKTVVGDSRNKIKQIKRDQKRAEKEFEQALEKLQLTSELRSLIDFARSLHALRQHRADSLFKAGREVFDFMNAIGNRLNIDGYDAVTALTWQEISESLFKGKLVVNHDIVSARKKDYGFIMKDRDVTYIIGDELAKEIAKLPIEEKVMELQGDIGFRGTYRGRVVIVTKPEEIDKVKKGDVLVSPMTDPYYVPAMIRAGAIVTDEGGILSHAAIVSRELGVPCIVGTGKATSVLKDGVIVEVDALGERGRVRIVKG
jgi:phosphoenolpyruvate synthase/pyruvate phosphate dikinase